MNNPIYDFARFHLDTWNPANSEAMFSFTAIGLTILSMAFIVHVYHFVMDMAGWERTATPWWSLPILAITAIFQAFFIIWLLLIINF